jgi:hypothetical protein
LTRQAACSAFFKAASLFEFDAQPFSERNGEKRKPKRTERNNAD